jgi:hypothetical protein
MEGGLFNNLWDYIIYQNDKKDCNNSEKYKQSNPSDGVYFNF